jgi:hypothetical protein
MVAENPLGTEALAMTQKKKMMPTAPVLVEDFEDAFRHGFDDDDPTVGLTDTELRGMPREVFTGMYVTAWARAEHCPVQFTDGRLELWPRYEPSPALYEAFTRHVERVRGVLFWAVGTLYADEDIRRRPRTKPFAASWTFTWGGSGEGSRN